MKKEKVKLGTGWPFEVSKDQLEIKFCRGSGPGGQNKNKRDTCCQMKHIPTGLTSQAQEHRTQEQNKKAAFNRLADQLVPIMKKLCSKEVTKEKYTEKIRTYTEKDNRVVDNRIENKKYNYSNVLAGDLEDLIKDLSLKK